MLRALHRGGVRVSGVLGLGLGICVRVGVRCFVASGGHKGVLCVRHRCGRTRQRSCVRVRDRDRVRVRRFWNGFQGSNPVMVRVRVRVRVRIKVSVRLVARVGVNVMVRVRVRARVSRCWEPC